MATIRSTIELIDKMSSTLTTIQGNIDKVKTSLENIAGEQTNIDNFSWDTFISSAEQAGKKMEQVGKGMTVAVTAPLMLLGKKMYGNAKDYESAFAGVKKTTEATDEQFEQLYADLLRMSETKPVNFVEASGIAEMGGQLGVAANGLIEYTDAYVDLQESTNIHGEEGAKNFARFINVTGEDIANARRLGGVIVDLGNNFATTEDEILEMATRMGATADLAGFSATEIFAISTALSSVGINAEAGGSAAGKLMKKMQMAAEVGGTAQERLASLGYEYENGLDFVNDLALMKKADMVGMANELGMTTDALQELGNSWLALDQFSEVMGITGEEFLSGWKESAAQSMLGFFKGLSDLDPEAGNSILAQLAEMDITEIRLSNLVAAMSGHPELMQAALERAYAQYLLDPNMNALADEASKRYATQESQDEMRMNKLNNTMADFGQNLVDALQPALDMANNLLDAFNSLSEVDQSNLIKLLGAAVVAGPAIATIGTTIDAFTKGYKVIQKFAEKAPTWGAAIGDFFTNPSYWGTAAIAGAAATGIYLLINHINNLKSDLEIIREGAMNIPITIDEAQYNESLSKIQEIQTALNGLKPGEISIEYENTSAAVAFGYGTQDMFDTAMAYQSAKASANINQIASDYAEKMKAAQQKIVDAGAIGDDAGAQLALEEYQMLDLNLQFDLGEAKANFSREISDLFNGMAKQYPEQAKVFEDAVSQYELVYSIEKYKGFKYYDYAEQYGFEAAEKYNAALMENVFSQAWDLGYMSDFNFDSKESMFGALKNGFLDNTWFEEFSVMAGDKLESGLSAISDYPIFSTWLQTILDNPQIAENLDTSTLTGALAGVFELLNYQDALNQAQEAGGMEKLFDFMVEPIKEAGKNVADGLGEGITAETSVPTDAGTAMGEATIEAINSATGVNSPSIYMIETGMNVVLGLAQGITSNQGTAIAAISSVGNAVINIGRSILSTSAGYRIGNMFAAGMASGIRAGSGAVAAAARSMVTNALAAANAAAGIHSPSRETYWSGEMLIAGYVNSIANGRREVANTIGELIEYSEKAWNKTTWQDIGFWAALEREQLMQDAEDEIKISDSDIRKIRQLAEREVINKFTTAEVKVDFTANNHINSNMDLDDVVDYLENRVSERLEAVAEGVYS